MAGRFRYPDSNLSGCSATSNIPFSTLVTADPPTIPGLWVSPSVLSIHWIARPGGPISPMLPEKTSISEPSAVSVLLVSPAERVASVSRSAFDW